MSNINKRILTSFPLLILTISAIYIDIILVLSLFIISSILIYEFLNILKKIFTRSKKNLFLFLNLFILYVCFFAAQIYFFLLGEFQNKQIIFLFILSICIFTDIGGYIFGNVFKGKKLTSISPNKTYSGMIGSFVCSLLICMLFIIYLNFSNSLISAPGEKNFNPPIKPIHFILKLVCREEEHIFQRLSTSVPHFDTSKNIEILFLTTTLIGNVITIVIDTT